MTKVTIQTKDDWAKKKIASAINTEAKLLKKAITRTQKRIKDFESRYGRLDRQALYGKVDDMELLEWEGEIEVLEKLKRKSKSLAEITFEFK